MLSQILHDLQNFHLHIYQFPTTLHDKELQNTTVSYS